MRRVESFRPAWHGANRDATRRSYDSKDGRKADKAFYAGAAWRRCRARILAGEPVCRDCRVAGIVTAAVEVHHELERKLRPDLAYEPANLTPLCKSCHSKRP